MTGCATTTTGAGKASLPNGNWLIGALIYMPDPTRAERQRCYRQHQKLGLLVIPVELGETDIEQLVDSGLLTECASLDSHCIGPAVERLVEALGETY